MVLVKVIIVYNYYVNFLVDNRYFMIILENDIVYEFVFNDINIL